MQAVTVSLEEDSEVIRPGDRVFLRAHTGRYIEVERDRACARWDDCGGWQELVIEKSPLVIEDTDSWQCIKANVHFSQYRVSSWAFRTLFYQEKGTRMTI